MTYNVFSGTLNPTQSINLVHRKRTIDNNEACFSQAVENIRIELKVNQAIYTLFPVRRIYLSLTTLCVSNGVKRTLIKRTQQRTVKENSDTFCQLLLLVNLYSSWQLLKDDSRETVFSLSQFRLPGEA